MRADVPADTRFVPIPARVLLRRGRRCEHPAHRPLAPPGARRCTRRTTSTPPSRLPTLVSVYDCSFVRYPELCTPEVRAFVPIVRRAIARGATVHTDSEFVAGEIEEIFGPGLRSAGRLVVIPLGVPDSAPTRSMPPAVAAAARRRAVRARDRHARTAQEPRRTSSPRSGRSRRRIPTCGS